jgi:hypothetical protein
MRRALVVGLLVAGCGPKKGDDPVSRSRAGRVATCERSLERFREASDVRLLACPSLYSDARCGAAWAEALEEVHQGLGIEATADIGRRCAEAYCVRLEAPPSLCADPDAYLDRGVEQYGERLAELDRAILTEDLGDAELAARLTSRRVEVLFNSRSPQAPRCGDPEQRPRTL